MRAVAQRVDWAEVRVDGATVGRIGRGLLAYIGAATGDEDADVQYIADKLAGLRIFEDMDGKMNLSVADIAGNILAVPAFTTMADARQGRRPAFVNAADPTIAHDQFDRVVAAIVTKGITVATGRFRETMAVESVNAGPICVLLDSRRTF